MPSRPSWSTKPSRSPEPPKRGQSMATDSKVPTLGESVTEATVARWLKKIGDAVAMDDPLVELETDKVTLEVNAPAAGTLSEIAVAEGSNVAVGAVLGRIGAAKAAPPGRPQPPAPVAQSHTSAPPAPPPASAPAHGGAQAGPRAAAGRAASAARAGGARGARAHDAAAPPHRRAPQRGAEQRRHAHHLQRGGHDRGDGAA